MGIRLNLYREKSYMFYVILCVSLYYNRVINIVV